MCIAVTGIGVVLAGVGYQFVRRWTGSTAFDLARAQHLLPLGATHSREAWAEAADILKMRWHRSSDTEFELDGPMDGRGVSIGVRLDPPRLRWRAALRAPMADVTFFAVPSGEPGKIATGDREFDRIYHVTAERDFEALRTLNVEVRAALLGSRATLSHAAVTHFSTDIPATAADGREVAHFIRLRAEPVIKLACDIDAAIAGTESTQAEGASPESSDLA